MGRYSLRAVLDKEPAVIAGSIRSVLYVLVLLNVARLDAGQLAGIALGLELVLTLFVRGRVAPVPAANP